MASIVGSQICNMQIFVSFKCIICEGCTCDIIASCSCMWCQEWRRHKCSSALQYCGCYGHNLFLNTTPRQTLLMKWQVSFLILCPPSLGSVYSLVSWISNGWVTPKLSWVTGTWKIHSILLRYGKMEQRVTALNVLRTGSWFLLSGCLLLNNRYHKKRTVVFNL